MLGLSVPTRPNRGHILVTERLGPLLRHPHANLRQTEEGTVMIGASSEDAGFDTSLDLDVVAKPLLRLGALSPRSARPVLSGVGRHSGSCRLTASHLHRADTHPGAFVVTCHSGVTLAAVHALELSEALLGSDFNARYAAFSPIRFSASAAARSIVRM